MGNRRVARESVRVFARGAGKGPKNVGIILPTGEKRVVTYRTFKYKYKENVLAEYVSAFGFIQFPPQKREANGQDIVDFTIKSPGTDGILIRVTVWPELQTKAVLKAVKGDFLAADGKLTVGEYVKDGENKQSVQISATQIAVIKGEVRAEREVVNTAPEGEGETTSLF